MTGIRVGTTPIKIVGYGCGDDTVPTAVKETRRLMEQLERRRHDRPAVR